MMKIAVLLLVVVAVANAENPGAALFSGFLSEHHDIKALFPKFKNVADADLLHNADLIAHAGKIAHILESLHGKTNWDDIDALSVQHKGLGITNKDHFNHFRRYFIKFNHFNADQTAQWNADFDKFFSHLFGHF